MAVAVGALAAQAGTAGAGSLRTGFLDPSAAGAGSIPGFPIDNAVTAQRVKGAGASIVRLYAFWQDSRPPRPTTPTTTNGATLDHQVKAAASQGLDVMLTLRSAPDWAQKQLP